MDHADHVGLLQPGVSGAALMPSAQPGTWADIGAGRGAFTLALADLLAPGSSIVAVDRDRGDVEAAARSVGAAFPRIAIRTLVGDFRRPLELPELDGIVMANALHFVDRRSQPGVLRALARHLRPGAPFVVVEYDADSGNPWVPHPFSGASWPGLASAAGLIDARVLARVPSRFLGAIYSAAARRPPGAR